MIVLLLPGWLKWALGGIGVGVVVAWHWLVNAIQGAMQ